MTAATPVSAADGDGFQKWLTDFQQQAVAQGISREVVAKFFSGVTYNPKVIKLDRHQPEFHLSFAQYLNRTVSPRRIEKGRKLYKDNKALLHEITARYGVPPGILLALWGIETDFGRITGNFSVIGALATLSYDPRRSDFFTRELMAALRLLDRGYLSPANLQGSWAGALGYLQFLPTVLLNYGVDYDNDGTIAIWQPGGDLFASGSNYLRASGWQRGWRWGREVELPTGLNKEVFGLSQKKSLREWQGLGARALGGDDLPSAQLAASLIQPDKESKRYFLVYENFRVLLVWNRSNYYALAVGLLADKIME